MVVTWFDQPEPQIAECSLRGYPRYLTGEALAIPWLPASWCRSASR
jgi:hypothetical protein